MEVYYGHNFWYQKKEGKPLKKFSVHKAEDPLLKWGKSEFFIPALYVGSEGAVLDLCMRVPLSEIFAYMQKWEDAADRELSEEEMEQAERESPFFADFAVEMHLDGHRLRSESGCSTVWNPCLTEQEEAREAEVEELMETYGCSREYGWLFKRESFEWEGTPALCPEKLECLFSAGKQPVTVGHFVTDGTDEGGQIELTHPVSGETYMITLRSCEAERHDGDWGERGTELEYPSCYQSLTYTVVPEISAGELTIQDCAKSDPPRKKNVLPAQEDGPTAYFLASSAAVVPIYSESGAETDGSHEAGEQKVWAACSALRFEPVDRIEWRAVFHIQEKENFHITAVLS